MITGYNTDVERDGVIYHVQTEDKGTGTPIILSLVYVGGAVLASKRSRYDDLLTGELDERVLADRLQRQHKLICAAVHAGRIEDLKRLSQSEAAERAHVDAQQPSQEAVSVSSEVDDTAQGLPAQEEIPETSAAIEPERIAAAASVVGENVLQVSLLEEPELRSGEFVNLRMLVSRGRQEVASGVANARVVLKALGTTFRPVSVSAVTDQDGLASVFVSLPAFDSGRAAILVRVEVDGEVAELRRIILPA